MSHTALGFLCVQHVSRKTTSFTYPEDYTFSLASQQGFARRTASQHQQVVIDDLLTSESTTEY